MKNTKLKSSIFAFSILSIFSMASCGDNFCNTCQTDLQCSNGQTCLLSEPHMNICAQQCSLTVWAEGEGYDAPCPAGVGTCPETCRNQNGVFGHCVPHEGLPDDVGICIIPTGDLICPQTVGES
jgi:hypothetical protein